CRRPTSHPENVVRTRGRRPRVYRPSGGTIPPLPHGGRMSIAESFLPEFDAEMSNTRRILERVPAEKWDWKPHAKSRSLGELATHVGELPRWGVRLQGTSFQVGSEKAPAMRGPQDLVARLEQNAAAARESLSSMSEADLDGQFQ